MTLVTEAGSDPTYFCAMQVRIWFLLPILWVQGVLVSPDLMKLPLLFVHYLEHKAASEDLDMAAFIALHYANDDHQTEDHGNHEKLPFHHHHGAALDQQIQKLLVDDAFRSVSFPVLSSRKAVVLPVNKDLLAGHHPELLRPPRTKA
jgi:hypothetical protein